MGLLPWIKALALPGGWAATSQRDQREGNPKITSIEALALTASQTRKVPSPVVGPPRRKIRAVPIAILVALPAAASSDNPEDEQKHDGPDGGGGNRVHNPGANTDTQLR
jgi:hypothetical protein